MCCLHVYLFESGAGACSGDSGGPFVCPNQVSMLIADGGDVHGGDVHDGDGRDVDYGDGGDVHDGDCGDVDDADGGEVNDSGSPFVCPTRSITFQSAACFSEWDSATVWNCLLGRRPVRPEQLPKRLHKRWLLQVQKARPYLLPNIHWHHTFNQKDGQVYIL